MQKDNTDKEYKAWDRNPTISKSRNKNIKKPEYTQKYQSNTKKSKDPIPIHQKQSKKKYEHKTVVSSITKYSTWNKGSSSIISPKEKKQKSIPKGPTIIIPTRDTRNYAAIIKQEINIDKEDTFIPNTRNDVYVSVPRIRRKYLTKYTSSTSGNSSHASWELAYYHPLLQLYNIFMDGMYKLDPNFPENRDTFYNFSNFVYNVSSTHISPYLEDLTPTQEDEYLLYTIKRQDFL